MTLHLHREREAFSDEWRDRAACKGLCSIHGCEKPATVRGWCPMHYQRWRRYGTTEVLTLPERIWKLTKRTPNGCWEWRGKIHRNGYGVVSVNNKQQRAHRVVYELLVEPIPGGLVLDHLCRNPPCVNPAHLEPVTQGENNLRGFSPPSLNARKTHCLFGHPYDEANTYVNKHGWRACRTCHRLKERAARRWSAA